MDKLEIAKEAVRIYFDENIPADKAIEKAENLFATDQSKQIDSKNNLNNILSPNCDIDNNEIYDIKTGRTIGEF